jgi:hypothetical protein
MALVVLILLACSSSAADIKKLGVIAGPLQVMFTYIINMLINLTWGAERERRQHNIKAMLPSLLGAHGHLQRRDQAIQRPWPPSYPFPVELPAYLSQQVLSEMITCFKEFLYDEIVVMMMSKELVRARSRQSISNSSTGSQEDEPPVSTLDDDDETDNPLDSVANLFGYEPDYPLDEEPDEQL